LIVVGGVSCLIALYSFASTFTRISSWQHVDAEVVDVVTKRQGGKYSHYPVFRFRDDSGEQHTYQANMGTNPPSWEVGDVAKIYYNPDNPSEVLVDTFWQKYLLAVICGGLAVVTLIPGINQYRWSHDH